MENSPIEEVGCLITVSDKADWSKNRISKLISELSKEYPTKESFTESTEEYTTIRCAKDEPEDYEWIKLSSTDGNHNIIIDNHIILILQEKPYTDWKVFRDRVLNAYNILKKYVEFDLLKNVGLRYINRINIPDTEKLLIHDYFNIGPRLEGPLSGRLFRHFELSVDLIYDSSTCLVSLQRAFPDKERNEQNPVILDLYYNAKGPLNSGCFAEWLETAHVDLKRLYKDCTTDICRNMYEVIE